MARPTKLTPVTHKKIISYLRAGAHKTHAAEAAGVDVSQVDRWVKRGLESDQEPYASFAADVLQAQAEDAVRSMSAITKAEQAGDWKAAAWKLERKYPKIYGSRSTHEIDAAPGLREELIPKLREYYGVHGLATEAAPGELAAPTRAPELPAVVDVEDSPDE